MGTLLMWFHGDSSNVVQQRKASGFASTKCGKRQANQRASSCSLRGCPFTPAVPVTPNCGTEREASPCSNQSAFSVSKGITKWSALISFRTRSISHFFLAQNLR
jgi:hypothetical protein